MSQATSEDQNLSWNDLQDKLISQIGLIGRYFLLSLGWSGKKTERERHPIRIKLTTLVNCPTRLTG